MCLVCGCYRGGIVVMDVFWRRLCVSIRGFIKFVSRWWKLKVGGGALRAGMGH